MPGGVRASEYSRIHSLPVVLQKLLHGVTLFRAEWAKSPLVVDEDDVSALEVDNHIGLLVAVDIDEAEGHRDEVGVSSVELGADVDTGVAGVTAGQFDDFNTSMEVDGQKMTR